VIVPIFEIIALIKDGGEIPYLIEVEELPD
jgi:hypothetical protein